jgi:hypothetical protein
VLAPSIPDPSIRSKINPFLIVSNIRLRNDGKALRDRPSKITAKLRSTGAVIRSATAYYYEGNPDASGVLFDMQKIDNISSGSGFIDTASFTPKTCGTH